MKVALKSEFMRRVLEMKNPELSEFYPGRFCDLLQTQWEVRDAAPGARDWFDTPTIRLSYHECYKERTMMPYYARVERARKKYYRWFQEAIEQKAQR